MYMLTLAILFALRTLRRLSRWAFPFLVSAVCGAVFLPMVLLGAAGLAAWRRHQALHPAGQPASGLRSRPRAWLVLLGLLGALEYAVAAVLLGADPLLLYFLVHLALLGSLLLALLGQPSWSAWQPATYLLALPAILPGSLVAAFALSWWPKLWRRDGGLGVYEAPGVEVPARVAVQAMRGLSGPPGGWALGYDADGRPVTVGDAEARHHTLVCGTPGAGKTTVLGLVLEGVAGRCPVVVIDGKASAALRRAVAAIPGSVTWTIGGDVLWDALRGDATSFAGKLLAAESFSPQAAIYEAAAARYVQAVGRLLALEDRPRDPRLVAELLQPPALRRYIRHLRTRFGDATPGVVEAVARMLDGMGRAELEGVAGFGARFGRFVEGTAGRGLGAGPGALVLEEAIRAGRTVLFSLDAAGYTYEAAKVGAWLLLELVAVAGRLQEESWSQRRRTQAYVLIDELTGLAREGVHVVPLLTRGREAGFACVVATQGLADLDRVGPAIAQQVIQNTAVKVVLRQGSATDAESWAGHLGRYEREEVSRLVDDRGRSLGRNSTRWQRVPYVSPDSLRALGTGDAVLSVVPLGGRPRRLEWLRVARPAAMRD